MTSAEYSIIALVLLIIFGLALNAWYSSRPPKPLSDAQLQDYHAFLIKHKPVPENKDVVDGPRRRSKPFKDRITTACLDDLAYEQIKKLFTPEQLAEYDERVLAIKNELSARAIESEMVKRRALNGVNAQDLTVIEREGLYRSNPIGGES
jgi:hypothetical protein